MSVSDDEGDAPTRPVIGVTMGDPAGIGPEVVVKALADPAIQRLGRFVVFGMNELMGYAADLAEIEPYWWRVQHEAERARGDLSQDVVVLDYDEFSLLGQAVHQPTKQGGQASLRFLDDAIAAALRGRDQPGHLDALVTAPISKESWHRAGCRFPGHTELLQHRTQAKRVVMMFVSSKLQVALATGHIPLMEIRNRLTIGSVSDPIDLASDHAKRLGVASPRVGVCGLNPHASENGRFGEEEQRIIRPAVEMAHNAGINAYGPLPADTLFHEAARGRYDLVVAMYHDQGLISVKLLDFEEAVNVTLGLPIIRTSPDHGTAFDLVGRNRADPSSMKSAIRVAARLAQEKSAGRKGKK
jgi:4-hydroxythreonine-4-phosphate dehydrogenase